MRDFEYLVPTSLDAVTMLLKKYAALGGEGAALKAGGIDLVDRMKEGIAAPASLINLLALKDLAEIADDPAEGLAIGPLATLDAIANHPKILARYPLLAKAAGRGGDPAAAQRRHARREPLPAPALLVLPQLRLPVSQEGRGHLLRRRGGQPLPRHLRRRALPHRQSLLDRPRAGGAGSRDRDGVGRRGPRPDRGAVLHDARPGRRARERPEAGRGRLAHPRPSARPGERLCPAAGPREGKPRLAARRGRGRAGEGAPGAP